VAVLVVGSWVPAVMSSDRLARGVVPERTDWSKLSWHQCFRQFMGLAVGSDEVFSLAELPIEPDDLDTDESVIDSSTHGAPDG
jgi:hypothetical protein